MPLGLTPRPPFDATALDEAVATYPDLSLELVAEAGSSNVLAAERARSGGPDGLVVVVDHQVAGRGRLDRNWETPAGAGVTFSMLVRPTVPDARWPWIPLLVGHNVAKALASLRYDARVKWPNDILLSQAGEERKVGGILVERVDTPTGPAAIIGVGLNVSTAADELPVPTATSLALADGPDAPGRDVVLLAAVTGIREGLDVWQAGDEGAQDRLRTSYLSHCATVGQSVRAELPGGETVEGRASDVDPDGRLVITTAGGEVRVGAGDVIHVRPAPRT